MPSEGRRKAPKPIEVDLVPEHNRREGLTVMRVSEDVSIASGETMVIIPGEKGHGWKLRVYKTEPVS